jgi:hypothetical protein
LLVAVKTKTKNNKQQSKSKLTMAKASKGNKKKSSEEEWTPKKNDKGLIMNWSCKSRDGRELKYYVDGGCCDDLYYNFALN